MLHILIFGGTAAVFFAMTLSTLFHLRWARRLPSLPELLGGNESLPMNRPTPDPSQEGSKRSSASSQFPSWEGLGVGSWSQITASKSLRLSKNRNTGPRHGMFSASLLHRAVPAACPPVRRVSVVLAARDEEARIETTIRHLLAQQFVPVDVTVVDDRSKDRTSEILQRLANEDARLRVIRVDLLPEGWLGKCHACHLGAAAATGDWILFTDADCWLKPDVIARALLMAELDGVDHITLTPGVAPHTPAARAWHLAFLITLTDWISGVNRDKPGKYLGLGAFNLARTTAYRQCGGYEALRLTVLDDVKLGLLLRRAGKRTRAFIGGDDTECHWGATAGSMVQVMEKNYFAALE